MMLVVLAAVSFLVFLFLEMAGGDGSAVILAEDATDGLISAFRDNLGVDNSFIGRYFDFLVSFFSGDWGYTVGGREIRSLVFYRASLTVSISVFSIIIAVVFSVPFSFLGSNRRTFSALFSSVFSVLISSLPSFLIALFLVLVFSLKLGWFPVSGYVSPSVDFAGYLSSIFLPAVTLSLLHSSLFLRVYRRHLMDARECSYVKAMVALGVEENRAFRKEILKPSLPLLFSLIAGSFSASLGGSAVIETVFALPGIGSLMVDATLSRDVQLSGIIIVLVAIAVSFVYLLLDIASIFVDPRLRKKE